MKKKNRSVIFRFILAGMFMVIMTGCKEDADITVTTDPVRDITSTSATCIGTIHSGEANFCGFTWSTNSTLPDNESYHASPAGTGDREFTGEFSVSLSGLTSGMTYYVRAYAYDYHSGSADYKVAYGKILSFTTR